MFRLALHQAIQQHVMSDADLSVPASAPTGNDGYLWRLTRGLTDAEKAIFGDASALKVSAWFSYAEYQALGAAQRSRAESNRRLEPYVH